ncbi:pyridoxamine 5'-phosphate oxidase family protein [uncultured Faecalibaculum sp.]|uniref:pyridoxamine 5'-phosphate oxidase family protein n=1 Tax=uncultured Faecalibaculum sp. TaxID=1729681 RepID=UPI002624DA69|nr:pyridoxamine 5'-phosphate oxidase family protein [uncultured Faecalibaculum sp.]
MKSWTGRLMACWRWLKRETIPMQSRYTTAFRSVIAFGTVEIMEDEAQKREAIELLARKYAPDDDPENRRRYIERDWKPLCMLKMHIEHITAKEAIELVRQKTGI